MCGRFAMDQKADDLIQEWVAAGNSLHDWRPTFSVAPTETAPIVRERLLDTGELERTVEPGVWDFWPMWQSEDRKSRNQFNTRIEAVASSGLWKRAFTTNRIIIPMTGYFEWTGARGDKTPHFLHGPDHQLAAAGICTLRREDDDWVVTFSVITREARDAGGEVHDRMPAFLTTDATDAWLSPVPLDTPARIDETLDLLRSASEQVAASITSYIVDKAVNDSHTVARFDPGVIQPVAS